VGLPRGRGGRKWIVAPDASDIVPSMPQPDGTLVKVPVRAWRSQNLLDAGVYTSITEIADAERINQSHASRVFGSRYWHQNSSRRSSKAEGCAWHG
jgi:hypothetical protein